MPTFYVFFSRVTIQKNCFTIILILFLNFFKEDYKLILCLFTKVPFDLTYFKFFLFNKRRIYAKQIFNKFLIEKNCLNFTSKIHRLKTFEAKKTTITKSF
jgi:hypothetical protein